MRTPWVSFDGKDCGGCKHLNERGYCEFTACIIPCEVKHRTNADRIRAMDIDHLIEWYCYHRDCGNCPYNCVDCQLRDWLKQEVEE